MNDSVDDKNGLEEPLEVRVEDGGAAGSQDVEVEDPVADLERRLAEEHDRLLRTAAELENLRKRARRDAEEGVVRGRADVLSALLPALDSIDMALKSTPPDGSAAAVLEGVEMVRRQFMAAMAPFGLAVVETAGARFDPAFHEAVAQLPSPDRQVGEIVEELRRGYVLGERLLRASMVIVSSGARPGEES